MSEITYTMVGDYNLPNLKLPEQTEVTLGRWSQMRRTYLKEHHKILYYNLLTKGILNSHLAEVQQRASELEETLVKQMAEKAGLTEQMKATDMMGWVRKMNSIKNRRLTRAVIAQQEQMPALRNFYRRRPEVMELHQPHGRNFI